VEGVFVTTVLKSVNFSQRIGRENRGLGTGFWSVMSEFIENPGENPKKQDCELKAFYRLAEPLKAAFPRLPILLTLDALYACGPVFTICGEYGWKFTIVLKDKDLPSVNEEIHALVW
jgi:hypothetical protein